MKPDVYDGLVVIGVALVGYGIAQWSIPAALVVVGVLLVATGMLGAARKGNRQ